MTSSSTPTYSAAEMSPSTVAPIGQGKQLRPKLPLLKVLRAAGARGETFTMKEVMHYLGQYIILKQLYDKQHQHMVYCGDDELGLLLGIQSFSVKEPSPLYDMLRKNLTTIAAGAGAAQALTLPKDQSIDSPSQDQTKRAVQGGIPALGTTDNGDAAVVSTLLKRQISDDDDDLMQERSQPQRKQPRLDFVFEEWDVAGLPWWFVGNLRNNYEPLSNGSTDMQTDQDIDIAVVSDTTDDLWFLNESESEKLSMEVKMESQDSEEHREGGREETDDQEMIEVAIYEDQVDGTQCLSDATDPGNDSEDSWQCTKCKKFNSPIKRYCFRCWALRKDWYADCPKLVHSLSTSNISSKPLKEDDKGIDIPDCHRTISAPVIKPKDLNSILEKPRLAPCSSILSLDLEESTFLSPSTSENKDRRQSSSIQTAELQNDTLLDCKGLLEPCRLCKRRPRNGNIIHGRTAHLVTCFLCAKILQKSQLPCPVCKKQIHMVVKIFVA
ncbi:protein Mdm4-like [Microcaecilia unicolor]|uniref:Protein Mdm4 n=1 Tax=Microcaecilia unicolor TaxID=1415580 RepID=A0A6P7XBD3_9AMPH|nr:protein Mdm4-like [Microcaecilia unicolor]